MFDAAISSTMALIGATVRLGSTVEPPSGDPTIPAVTPPSLAPYMVPVIFCNRCGKKSCFSCFLRQFQIELGTNFEGAR